MQSDRPWAVVFDLDGTLLDTIADIARAMNTVLERHGIRAQPHEAYRIMVGSGFRSLVERATARAGAVAGEELVAAMTAELREEYARNPVVETAPYAGVPQLLDTLAANDVPCAVLSNKADDLVQVIVHELLGRWEFRAVLGLRDGSPAKPDPATALEVAAALGAPPGEIIYLGDSDVDMETATRAGMVAVGAGWGFRGEEELREAGASAVLSEPLELLDMIGGRSQTA
jgi:phosphoglycolate phosphatase